MNVQFKELFTVTVSHTYYSGSCEDIRFVITESGDQQLRRGKLLARVYDGRLHVLFEANDAGVALGPVPGVNLRLGLHLDNPCFSNFTQVDADFASKCLIYGNAEGVDALSAPVKVQLVGRLFSHTITNSARPVTVFLKDSAGQIVQTDVVKDADRKATSYDLSLRDPGGFRVEEVFPATTGTSLYFLDADLVSAGVFGVLDIKIAAGFYSTAPAFELEFDARRERLNYYVVAKADRPADLDPLTISDAGFTEDGRSEIKFDKIPSASFTPAEISPDLLGDSSNQVVLFRSRDPLARTQKARRKIQLTKNHDVVIPHLPQPGPERNNANLIVPVSK